MTHKIRTIKIGFVGSSPADGRILSSWPGTQYFMKKALTAHGGDVIQIGPVRASLEVIGRLAGKAAQMVLRKRYDYRHSIILSKKLARMIEPQIFGREFDVLFVPATSTEAAYISDGPPIVYTSDATFAALLNYYPIYSDLLSISVTEGDSLERRTIQRASLDIYPSDWAGQSAIQDYGADSSRVHVVPYGANLESEDIPSRETVLSRCPSGTCRLLFIGVDWERKGGDIAFETLLALLKMNLPTELVVCGCVPPPVYVHERMKVVPRLDKSDPRQRKELSDLFMSSDFLVLPTRGECYGMVFCEASAFGVPSIATATGGVSGAIADGRNGFLMPKDATGRDYADAIFGIYRDAAGYRELCRTSRREFDDRLNWDTWGGEVTRLMAEMI